MVATNEVSPLPDSSTAPPRRRSLGLKIAALAAIALLLSLTAWWLFLNPTPEWDGGRWGPIEIVPTGANELWLPTTVEFRGTLFAFSPALSAGAFTATGVDDAALYDVLVRSFDGLTWQAPQAVGNWSDNRSEFAVGAEVMQDRLYLATSTLRKLEDGAHESDLRLYSFDGASWRVEPGIRGLAPERDQAPIVDLVFWRDALWAFWQNADDVAAGMLRARSLTSSAWGAEVAVGTGAPEARDFRFENLDGSLLVAWFSNSTLAPAGRGVRLGNFSGDAITGVESVSSDNSETDPDPVMVAFGTSVAIFWTSGHQIFVRFLQGGRLSEASAIGEGFWLGSVAYRGRLYLAAVKGFEFPTGRTQWSLVSYDGARWSAPFIWTTSRYSFEVPRPLEFSGKLYVHWVDGTPGAWVAHIRSYER